MVNVDKLIPRIMTCSPCLKPANATTYPGKLPQARSPSASGHWVIENSSRHADAFAWLSQTAGLSRSSAVNLLAAELKLLSKLPSIIARNRTVMRRLPVRQIEHDLIDIAPAPSFRRIVAFDDRMAGGVEMLGGVLVGRSSQQPTWPQLRQIRKCSQRCRSSGIPRSRARLA